MLDTTPPIVDYRGIHSKDGAFYSKTKTLCNHCANPICDEFAAQLCGEFVPTIKFTSLKGIEGEFNTFRIGDAWSRRVSEGMTVALMNSKKNVIMCFAEVTSVFVGDKFALADMFSQDNHSIKALDVIDDVPEKMLKRLKNASGTMIYNANERATVIYLKVIDYAKNEKEAVGERVITQREEREIRKFLET